MDTTMEFIGFILGYLLGVDISTSGYRALVSWTALHTILGFIGAVLSVVGFVMPCLTTIADIEREQSVGNRSPVAYIANFVNCLLWVIYGCSITSYLIVTVNAVGTVSQFYCLVKFLYYSEDHDRQGWYVYLAVGSISALLIVLFYSADMDRYTTFFRWACAICRSLPPIAPLLNLGVVNVERNMLSMPTVLQCGISLATASFWAGFGSTVPNNDGSRPQTDRFIFVPSIVGILSACIQLLLHILLRGEPAV